MLAYFFVLRPMIPLTLGVAILDRHTRLTCLEINNAPVTAAIGTADDDIVHGW